MKEVSLSADGDQGEPVATSRIFRRHDHVRRLVVELAGIDLLRAGSDRGLRRRRAGRTRTLVQYALLAARPAA